MIGNDARQLADRRSPPSTLKPALASVALPKPRGAWSNAVAFSLAGFVIGAVFWHFVGFWDFMSAVVFKGPDEIGVTNRSATARPKSQAAALASGTRSAASSRAPVSSSLTAGIENCSSYFLDRKSGLPVYGPCEPQSHELPLNELSQRGDLWGTMASSGNGWTVQVDAGTEPRADPRP